MPLQHCNSLLTPADATLVPSLPCSGSHCQWHAKKIQKFGQTVLGTLNTPWNTSFVAFLTNQPKQSNQSNPTKATKPNYHEWNHCQCLQHCRGQPRTPPHQWRWRICWRKGMGWAVVGSCQPEQGKFQQPNWQNPHVESNSSWRIWGQIFPKTAGSWEVLQQNFPNLEVLQSVADCCRDFREFWYWFYIRRELLGRLDKSQCSREAKLNLANGEEFWKLQ